LVHSDSEPAGMTKVLVIDDEPVVRHVVSRILRTDGFDTVEAEDGVAGVELALKELPDLILCDVLMPRRNGYDTLLELQKHSATEATPFIFMTGKKAKEDLRRGMEFGADDYLTKPFTRDQLLGAVHTRLGKRKRLTEASQKQMDELRGRIMYVLPHELRTPLTAILGLGELLVSEGKEMERERVATVASGIMSAAERLSRIVENYLVYSQVELIDSDPARRDELRQIVLADPAATVAAAATRVSAERDRDSDLRLVTQVTAPARVSEENLSKVAEELVDNACKFSPPGSAIEVSTGLADGRFSVHVSDRGRGMSPDEIARIGAYNQFRREVYEQQGTGLGLSIAKRLTELHGGGLSIESEPGSHTTVRVWLPTAQA